MSDANPHPAAPLPGIMASAGDLLDCLMDNSTDRIYFKDPASRFLKINKALADWFALASPRDAIGKTDADFFTSEHAQQALEDERRVMRSGMPLIGFEEQETWPDGRVSWVSTTKMPLRDRTGAILGTFGISRDITQRKLAELAQRTSEQRTRLIIDTARDAFVGMDAQGLVTDWNYQAEITFGWLRDEAIGQPVAELIVPRDEREDFRAGIAEFMRTGEGRFLNTRLETIGVDRQGRHFPVEMTIAPIRIAGSWFFASFIHDITQRRRAARELQQAKDSAESASRAKSDFLANMSHEIRTPMNAIIGMTELVLETPLAPEQREFLGMAKDSADSLLKLLNDILDFSKIEAGRLDLDEVAFPLRDSLLDMLRTLAVRAEQKGLELACRIRPGVPEHLLGDPDRLRQILVNLIGNAIKFTQHGEIVVDVEAELLTDEAATLHFSVRDTGIGIPAEKHAQIFQAFVQADGSTTRDYGGTGLGLTISAQLVGMMGGRIWVESTPGLGSTFHFTARLTRPPAGAAVAELHEPPSLHGLPVLIVDDNATNRRILSEMVSNWQMCPTAVDGAAAAIAALEQARSAGKPFALVLLDAVMPEVDGFALAQRIGSRPELATSTLMMLSSACQSNDAARCRDLGVAAYLSKPIKQSDLLDAVMTALAPRTAGGNAAANVAQPCVLVARRPLCVLLAEDNAVNQRLAVRLLEKWGHRVRVATTGREVLSALDEAPADVVLMDVQMPEMDGYETTTAIRQRERTSGGHLPIWAMTAHAMKGDCEHCLAVGMDGYIAKPIQPRELFLALEAIANCKAKPELSTTGPEPPEGLDECSALAHCGGDPLLLREVTQLFLDTAPAMLEQLASAAAAGDSRLVERHAHSFKSSLGHLGARQPMRLAADLESSARQFDAGGLALRVEQLATAIDCLVPALRERLGQCPTAPAASQLVR